MAARPERAGLNAPSASGGASGRGLGAPVVGASFDAFLRALPRLASAGPLRRRVLGEEHDLLDRFLAAIGVEDPREIDSARRQRTMASLIHRVRGAYASLSPAAQRRWLPLEEGVEPVLRSGGVLLLATHFGGGLLTPLALSRLGVPILTIVRSSKSPRLRASLEHPLLELQDLEQVPGYAAAAKAVATLREGGVVFLAGDLASERGLDPGDDAAIVLDAREDRLVRTSNSQSTLIDGESFVRPTSLGNSGKMAGEVVLPFEICRTQRMAPAARNPDGSVNKASLPTWRLWYSLNNYVYNGCTECETMVEFQSSKNIGSISWGAPDSEVVPETGYFALFGVTIREL